MSRRVEGDYFSIFTDQKATNKQPTQTGKLCINEEMLEAIMVVAKSQQESGSEILVDIGLGFWVQTAKDSGNKYMRGRPNVYITDEMLDGSGGFSSEPPAITDVDDIPF